LVLCALLVVGEPVSLALVASGRTVELAADPIALAAIVARLTVTAIGVAAGIALWTARPSGPVIAKTYLVVSSVLIVLLAATRRASTNLQPGVAVPLVIAIVTQNVLWFAYLTRSRQVADRTST
jgi:hypothetical protein